MKKLLPFIVLFAFLVSLSFATTLQEVYTNSLPGLGYDRLLILNADSVYNGGISINNETVGIKGNGAIIDLNSDSIYVFGESQIDIDGCVIINGKSGLAAHGIVNGLISHCTFYGNEIGIHFMSDGMIEVVNTIISNSTRFGYACDETSTCILHYIDSYQNTQGNFMEWCSG